MAKPEDYNKESCWDFIFDTGKIQKHPILRVSWGVVQQGQGEYFFNKAIKNYEYLGEF